MVVFKFFKTEKVGRAPPLTAPAASENQSRRKLCSPSPPSGGEGWGEEAISQSPLIQ